MKKFPVNISPNEIRRQLNQTDSYSRRFAETSLRGLLGFRDIPGTLSNRENVFPPVPWEFEKLRQRIHDKISPHIYGWYDEAASASRSKSWPHAPRPRAREGGGSATATSTYEAL